jgi:hypothetical protein
MKKKIFLSVFLVSCSCIAILTAQPPKKLIAKDESGEVKERLEKLFTYANKGQYKKAAETIVYKGTDSTRKLKDVLDDDKPEELEQAMGICMNLHALDSAARKKEYYRFYIQKQPEGLWYNWIMVYHMRSGQHDTATFGFLKIKDKFALGGVK